MDVLQKSGKKVVLLGNEAIARGAMEAGMGIFASYPGTPSSEVPITLAPLAKKQGFYFEYSSNEKIAFETVTGASWSGVRSMTSMKHFGLNVASDSVGPIPYTGVKGGLVLMVADDPNGWSSGQSEQDVRYYSRMFKIPTIEPSNPQECLDFTKFAFDLSEEFEVPVMLRTTTMVSHSIGTVKLGKLKKPKTKGKFKKERMRYYCIRPNLQKMHRELDKKIAKIQAKHSGKMNKLFKGKGKVGIIASGVSFEYVREIMADRKLKVPLLKIGMTFPLPEKMIAKFIKGKREVLILEELEPIIENSVKLLAKEVNPKLKVRGKDLLPSDGEYTYELVAPAVEKVFKLKRGFDFKAHQKRVEKAFVGMTPRKPVFCPGCPHRSTFYAVREVYGDKTIYAGDVGCYVLGIFEPFMMQDFMVSMGASIGISHGFTRVSDQEVVAFVGDSTFFHAALPSIANLRFDDGKSPLVVVMDNSVTAMTGHQPNPGTGITGMGDKATKVSIEEAAKALGAEVRVANSFSQKQLIKTIKEMKKIKGPKVLVSRGECRLITKHNARKKGINLVQFQIDQKKCKKCGICTDKFACPAIVKEGKGKKAKFYITDMCWGCSVCSQICPYGAIHPEVKK